MEDSQITIPMELLRSSPDYLWARVLPGQPSISDITRGEGPGESHEPHESHLHHGLSTGQLFKMMMVTSNLEDTAKHL